MKKAGIWVGSLTTLSLLAAISLFAPGGMASQVGWDFPVTISADLGGNADNPAIAVTPDGSAVGVWQQWDGSRYNVWGARFSPQLGWQAATLIEFDNAGSALEPKVSGDSAGNVLAVWSQNDGTRFNIVAARYVAGTGWTSPIRIETNDLGDARSPDISMNAAGDAVVVWTQSNGARLDLMSNIYLTQGGWLAGRSVEADDLGDAREPRVAMRDNGDALAVWVQWNGSSAVARASRLANLTNWTTPTNLSLSVNGNATEPRIGVSSNGTALAVWTQVSGATGRIASSRYDPSSGWLPVSYVSSASGNASSPDLALIEAGRAVAVWIEPDLGRRSVWSSEFLVDTGWGLARLLETNTSGDASAPRVTIDVAGNGLAVWHQSDGAIFSAWYSRLTPGLGWTPARLLEYEDLGNALRPVAGNDGSGGFVAAWTQNNGSRYNIVAAVYAPIPVSISEPVEGASVGLGSLVVSGSTTPGCSVAVNGVLVAVGFEGSFSGRIVVAPGINSILVATWDSQGNSVGHVVRVSVVDSIGTLLEALSEFQTNFSALTSSYQETSANQTSLATLTDALVNATGALNRTIREIAARGNVTDEVVARLEENLSRIQFLVDELVSFQDDTTVVLEETSRAVYAASLTLANLTRDLREVAGAQGYSEGRINETAADLDELRLQQLQTNASLEDTRAIAQDGLSASENAGRLSYASLAIAAVAVLVSLVGLSRVLSRTKSRGGP